MYMYLLRTRYKSMPNKAKRKHGMAIAMYVSPGVVFPGVFSEIHMSFINIYYHIFPKTFIKK